jgi:inorganic phosphate transporter, PiT family
VLQGANVADAVGTGIVGGISLTAPAATILLLLAAGLVVIGIFTGYPIATAFTVTGAVIGVGLALGGTPVWPAYLEIATLWVLIPFVGGGIAYLTARLLRNENIPERYSIPFLGGIVGLVLANIPFTLLGSTPSGVSIAATIATRIPVTPAIGAVVVSVLFALLLAVLLRRDLNSDVERAQQHFLLALGGLVAFSAGGARLDWLLVPYLRHSMMHRSRLLYRY